MHLYKGEINMRRDDPNYQREYRLKNKDKIKIQRQTHYKENKEKICLYGKKYRKTINGLTNNLWAGLNQRTINGSNPNWKNKRTKSYLDKGIELRFNRDELKQFVTDNWNKFLDIWNNNQRPSLDRIGPSIHYELGNIKIINMEDNGGKIYKIVQLLSQKYPNIYKELSDKIN